MAVALLLVGGVAQFAWHHAPEQAQADVWNVSQAMLVLFLLAAFASAYRSVWTWSAAALLGSWQLLTVACSLAYLLRPWQVRPGEEQCSAALNVPFGAIGAWLLVLMIAGAARPGGGAQRRRRKPRSALWPWPLRR